MRSTDLKPELPGKFITPIALGTILQPLNSSMIAVALLAASLVGLLRRRHA
ncbi:MYXO-CTERM sorting domain-containing protein [Saccharopolyspora spinosa]|uniref:MYXO-CTERM sorting domain-containing protein n=1 Tax=Saccharopolyspora spinosa TaxID=60894 RepID=UPI000237B008|nr:MYXO-CTERM sorting domain-containing protein [Saccharopolyspora spinosa]